MTPQELEIFRLKFRMKMVERLALRVAFFLERASGKTTPEAAQDLSDHIRTAKTLADTLIGPHVKDAGMTALYTEEISEMTEALVALVETLAREDS